MKSKNKYKINFQGWFGEWWTEESEKTPARCSTIASTATIASDAFTYFEYIILKKLPSLRITSIGVVLEYSI
jgi:hypothetical protein